MPEADAGAGQHMTLVCVATSVPVDTVHPALLFNDAPRSGTMEEFWSGSRRLADAAGAAHS